VDLREKFDKALHVCPNCGWHRRIGSRKYVEILSDPGSFKELFSDIRPVDPLRFEAYADRLAAAQKRVGMTDAVLTGEAALTGVPLHIAAMEFSFMGGSMGSVVGEKIARLTARSLKRKVALVIVSASGGARMQEGVLSLMQMAKTSPLIAQLRDQGIPYISIMTNPTTGGVSASYAMQGDVNLAEPGALIGFAGPRVIKQTIGQDLPQGFQTSEFLVEHGMVDAVVPRSDLADTVARLIRLTQGLPAVEAAS
jgi:acetyl-CoA carboxylase carboxyl transferase subunit beta